MIPSLDKTPGGPGTRWFGARLIATTALVAALAAGPALAQAPSTNATVNLIQLLVKNKVITQEAGAALLAQAEAEAAQARAAQAAGAGAAAGSMAGAALPPPAPGSIRVPHIPEAMRAQIKDDIKKEVLAQAQSEGWAAPDQVPSWVKGVRLYGDLRVRNESVFYSDANAEELIDFETFNQIAPIDINANTNPTGFPILNTRTDRPSRLRVRARMGLKAQLNDEAMIAFRLAGGDDRSPVSTNQLLGGGFGKKDVWIDQAYVKLTPLDWLSGSLGRFGNPFRDGNVLFDVTELVFDNDVNFDGVAVSAAADQWLPENARLQLTGGAFPLGYADPEFPRTSIAKAGDGASKWLFSGQLRGGYSFGGEDGVDVSGQVAFHSFKAVQGQLSAPCDLFNGNQQCSTDQFQPIFLRKGNTLFFLRDINPDPASQNDFAQPQRLGLAFDYDVLELKAAVDFPITETLKVHLEGQYVNNLAFDADDICRFNPKGLPINNIAVAAPIEGAPPFSPESNFYTNPCVADSSGRIAKFEGGNQGFFVRGVIGTPRPRKFGEWNVELSYRYLESDAVLDSLADSDFRFGGTNSKGYVIGGSFGLSKNVTLVGRWLSANEISGPPLAIDILQIDLVAEF